LKKADLVIVVTCAYRKEAEDLSIQVIRRVLKGKRPDATAIVGGCMPIINSSRLKEVFSGPTFSPRTMNKIDDIINARVKLEEIEDSNIPSFNGIYSSSDYDWKVRLKKYLKGKINRYSIRSLSRRLSRKIKPGLRFFIDLLPAGTRSFIKKISPKKRERIPYAWAEHQKFSLRVAWGCLGKCTYCAVKYAIGPLTSKPLGVLCDEFKKALKKGYKKFCLLGDDVGEYGIDIGHSISELLWAFFQLDKENRCSFYIRSSNPEAIVRNLEKFKKIVATGKIKELLLPVQSGSERILKLMGRKNNVPEIKNAFWTLLNIYPDLEIVSTIIVGFPGETEKDFQASLDIIKQVNFRRISIFKYHAKPNTEAAAMPNHVPRNIINARVRRIKTLLKERNIPIFIE